MAAWLGPRPGRASAETPAPASASALDVHRATRNTRLGAIGTRLRAARPALATAKPYPDLPRHALPAPSWDDGRPFFQVARGAYPASGFAGEPCSALALSRLLWLANGVTKPDPQRPLRAAPSAGALYAGEVYVVADRVDGVPPGVYAYAVVEHALVRLRAGRTLDALAAALERPGRARGAAAALLLTNVFARYRVRYANRGYRYALIDSGHIGENVRLAAAELGLGERQPRRWEDARLNALLGVDGREEAVCAVHLVGRPAPGAPDPPARALVERQRADAAGLAALSDGPERYHAATALVEAPAGAAPALRTPGPSTAAPRSPASEPDAAAMPVHEAIRVRRSARRFEGAALARADLERILDVARGDPALGRRDGVDLHAVAHRVEGVAPGLYRWDPDARRLVARRTGRLSGELVEAALGQHQAGEAAVALIGVARLAETGARRGARAYRELLLEAGALAQRVYLSAEAQGLAARNLAAYYDDDLDALLGLDGVREVAVHLTAVGPGD